MRIFLLKMMIVFFVSSVSFAAEEKIIIEAHGVNTGKGGRNQGAA
jgi:hypothetical protein